MFRRGKPVPTPPSAFDEVDGAVWEPGIVQFALDNRTFQILMMPGSGHADGGIPVRVDTAAIPFELRTPNTRIMARRDGARITAVRRPGPKTESWFRRTVDIPDMTQAQVLEHLLESTSHVVIRLRGGTTLEGWVSEIDGTDVLFEQAPSPFFAQATGTGEMAPPPERISAEDIAAWMDDERSWHEMPEARGSHNRG